MPNVAQPAADARILWDVMEEHFDEAEFLFGQWRTLLDSPLYTHEEFAAGPEARLLAHLDGLAIGGLPVVERILWPLIAQGDGDAGRVRVAALAVAQLGDRGWLDAVVAELGRATDRDHREALAQGLVASDRGDVSTRVAAALERSPDAVGRAQWLQLLAARGGIPGPAVSTLLADPDPEVRAAALATTRFAGSSLGLRAAESMLHDPDEVVRGVAAEVGCIFGSHNAWSSTLQQATQPSAPAAQVGPSMARAALIGEPRYVTALIERVRDESVRADALWALGLSGRVAAADAVLDWLGDEDVGPLAAEAFRAITALPDDERYFPDPVPTTQDEAAEEEDVAFEDDDLDADLSGAPQDDLPLPASDAIRAWWSEHRAHFDPMCRFVAGRHAHSAAYAEALGASSMRRRHSLALEVAMRTHGAQHLASRALCGLQRADLAAIASLRGLDGQRGFSRFGGA